MRLDDKIWGRRSIRRNRRRQSAEDERGKRRGAKVCCGGRAWVFNFSCIQNHGVVQGSCRSDQYYKIKSHIDREQERLVPILRRKENNGDSGSHHVAAKVRIPTPTETSQHDVHAPSSCCAMEIYTCLVVLLTGDQRIRPNRHKLRSQSVNADAKITHADAAPGLECRKSSSSQRLCGRSRIILPSQKKYVLDTPALAVSEKERRLGNAGGRLRLHGAVSQATRAR